MTMKPSETEAIYKSACHARRIVPQQEEGQLWHKVLRDYEARDVRAGLDAWWASTERDDKGDLKSKWLPAPAELKPYVERAQRKREVAAREPKVLVAWECPSCRYRCSGYIPVDDTNPRNCRRSDCGGVMNVAHRESCAA